MHPSFRYNYIGFFDINTLSKAHRYATKEAILKLELNENKITGLVKGSRDYTVHMEFDKGILMKAQCNCPLENGKCKHAAAILVYLDELELSKMQRR